MAGFGGGGRQEANTKYGGDLSNQSLLLLIEWSPKFIWQFYTKFSRDKINIFKHICFFIKTDNNKYLNKKIYLQLDRNLFSYN